MQRGAVRQMLLNLFREVVRSVSAEACMPARFDRPVDGRTLVIALGKGAAAMAATAVARLGGQCDGLVITRAGHAGPPHRLPPHFELLEAGHPVPDSVSTAAAARAMALASALGRRDRLLMLVSGGGSALMSMPAPGVTLADKQVVTQSLLRSGATIAEINCIRKHLSRIKGGRLAVAAAPAQVTTLLISDVPGDDPSFVASGPTVADPTTLSDAREIVARYGIEDAHLATRDWFVGEAATLADIALFAYTHRAEEGGFGLDDYPAIGRWLARVADLPGFVTMD
ncbi:DUF4147 domain-containing protein [Leptolyngbya sp. 15MV]|nr:DUF4147 domain-containing protein [Leptolyngbya sp. 15MV]